MNRIPAEKTKRRGIALILPALIWLPAVCGLVYCQAQGVLDYTLAALLIIAAAAVSTFAFVALCCSASSPAAPSSTTQAPQQDALIRAWLIRDVLSGAEAAPRLFEQYFPGSSFCAAVIRPQLTPAQLRLVADKLSMPGVLSVCSFEADTVAVYAAPDTVDPAAFGAALEKQLRRIIRHPISCHAGTAVSSLSQLSDSYTDALIHCAPALCTLLSAFRDHLVSGDQPQLISTLQQMEDALSQLEPAKQRLLCLQTLSVYLQYTSTQSAPPLSGGETTLTYSSNQQLFRMIRHAITNLSTSCPDSDQSTPSEIQDILLDYVDQNCLDSALCLNSAADYLNTSIYVVSRIFKDATGVGFKEYITAKRLQYACHLLETTSKTVGTVAAEAGFENSTYFTTVFKNEYGMPPSKYRAATRHDAPVGVSGDV